MNETAMATRTLGRTGIELTAIGVGAWAMGGGGWKFGWGSQDDTQSIEAIRAAIDHGVNWIDTARIYGLGHSEQVVAAALDGVDRDVRLVTKCSRVWDDAGNISGCLEPDSIRRELEASLEALGGRRIDVYLIHQPKPDADIEKGWETLLELKREGAVGHVGVSNFSVDQLRRAASIGPIDVLEPPYSLIQRDIEDEILPYCEDNGIGVIAYSPMGSGLLTGRMSAERVSRMDDDDWRKADPRFNEPLLSRHLEVAESLTRAGERHGLSAGAAACAWVLGDRRVHSAIVGFRNPAQVADVLGAPEAIGRDDVIADIRARTDELATNFPV